MSDIAESIINALLPEDEDDRRDLIGDDYQLQSDIETFEEFTGKVIQPEDREPILGDEIELEDVKRLHEAVECRGLPRRRRAMGTPRFLLTTVELSVSSWSRSAAIPVEGASPFSHARAAQSVA